MSNLFRRAIRGLAVERGEDIMHTIITGQKVRFLKARDTFIAQHCTVNKIYDVTAGPRKNGEVCIVDDVGAEIWLMPGEWESV